MSEANRHRRFTLALIFLTVVVNLADRQIINILAQDIKSELSLSDGELGLLTGSAFGIIYALVGLPAAWIADRGDRTRVIALMVTLWSLCTILCGLAGGIIALFIARMGVGAGESGAQPACTAYVRDIFADRPNVGLSLMMLGNPIGASAGLLLGGIVAGFYGWRTAFFLAGLPGFALAFVIWKFLKDPRPRASREGGASWMVDSLRIVRQPAIPALIVATMAALSVMYASAAWLPAFFMRVHNFSTTDMGFYGAVITAVGGAIGVLSGMYCDFLSKHVRQAETAFLVVNFALAGPAMFLVVYAPSSTYALVALLAFTIFTYAWLAPATRVIQDAVPSGDRALAFAICGGAGILFSLGVSVPAIGGLSDLLTESQGLFAIGNALIVGMLLATVVACVSYALASKTKSRRDRWKDKTVQTGESLS